MTAYDVGGRTSDEAEALGTRLSPTARTEAFSDGVIAIAITLLVLEIKIPTGQQIDRYGSLLRALLHAWPSYLSYLATFLTIGVMWLNHHALFAKFAQLDRSVQWWNLMLMLTISFLPFPNALVADSLHAGLFSEEARTATAVYALAFTASAVPWVLMWRRAVRVPALLEPGWTPAYARREVRRSGLGFLIYGISVAVALAAPLVALGCFIGLALFYGWTSQGSRPPR